MSRFEQALDRLPAALRSDVSAHWERFNTATADGGMPLPTDAVILEPLVRVWSGSDFVARACTRGPALFNELLDSGDLMARYSQDSYSERLATCLDGAEDETSLAVALRRFRRREMVRIAWRDLADLAPLEEILADLSNLADTAVQAALRQLHGWQCERFGTPRDAQGKAQQLVVLGMGKLGGQELNFSSDIDLIFAFPEKGQTDARRAISNEEFFRRLGQRLIKILNELTDEGLVFRVDMRLRPFGDAGPLAMPFSAFEDYYQTHGREWERYAMIKARVIAGDRTDGERLLASLRPFVYRRYLDYGAFESLRTMKILIAREVKRKGLRHNVKLGPGGIREIEFIGQAFQLVYGGREPALRERRILPVLDYLADSARLPVDAVAGLKQAYEFLRRTENRLQAWADQQTHDLPGDPLAKQRLAYAMDFADWSAFVEALMRHVNVVSDQFDQVFAMNRSEETHAPALNYTAVWSGAVGAEAAAAFLEERNFANPDQVLESLQRLKNSSSSRALSQQGQERMDRLMPLLLEAVTSSPQPAVILERIIRLLEAVARRSVYLVLLAESPVALAQLVKLCAASVWIADYLTRYPMLLDDLLHPATLYAPLHREQLQRELERDVARADAAEQTMDALRHFEQTNVLRVAAADVSGALPLMRVSDYLTEIAEVLLQRVLQLAWADLVARFGRPRCTREGTTVEPGFITVAYGKLGGIELGYGSDLDLVFLHDSAGENQYTDGSRQIDNISFFAKLAQRIIHLVTAHTAAGVLYEVDTRLRPSGRSGLLVSSIAAFAEYQRNQAWTWEHQALVRARAVAGPPALGQRFAAVRNDILSQPRDVAALRREVRDMRERMRTELGSTQAEVFDIKQDPGGIADVEFMVQYAVLASASRHPELLTYTDNIRQLDGLEQVGLLSSADATLLRDAYRSLRRRVHRLKLQEQPGRVPATELRDEREAVQRIWRLLME